MSYYLYHVRITFENALVMICKDSVLLKVIHASIICQLKLGLNLMKALHALVKATVSLAIHRVRHWHPHHRLALPL